MIGTIFLATALFAQEDRFQIAVGSEFLYVLNLTNWHVASVPLSSVAPNIKLEYRSAIEPVLGYGISRSGKLLLVSAKDSRTSIYEYTRGDCKLLVSLPPDFKCPKQSPFKVLQGSDNSLGILNPEGVGEHQENSLYFQDHSAWKWMKVGPWIARADIVGANALYAVKWTSRESYRIVVTKVQGMVALGSLAEGDAIILGNLPESSTDGVLCQSIKSSVFGLCFESMADYSVKVQTHTLGGGTRIHHLPSRNAEIEETASRIVLTSPDAAVIVSESGDRLESAW